VSAWTAFFFLLLTYKHKDAPDKIAFTFKPYIPKLSGSVVERAISKIEEAVSVPLENSFVRWISKEVQNQRGWVLNDYPNVAMIADCCVQQMNKPAVEFQAAKAWFSGKHYIYCIKSEVAHCPKTGVAMQASSGHEGARHDLEVFRSNSDEYKRFLRREQADDDEAYWAMMGDKGYIGADTIEGIVAVLPFKKNER
jgi:hypothetical protein